MTDQFFTPNKIASSIVVGLTTKVKVVADFTIGDGSLLRALPFTPKKSIGLDLDPKVINDLKSKYPSWKLKVGNFLNQEEKTSKWLSKWLGKIDLVLLNPPFSCRGGTYIHVDYKGESLAVRTALCFVIKSLEYLTPKGILIAILPLSILKSIKDKKVLDLLRSEWEIDYGDRLDRNSFIGCNPNSVVITLQRKQNKLTQKDEEIIKFEPIIFCELIRGLDPMYKSLQEGKYKLIHTTNISHGSFNDNIFRYVEASSRFISGEFLVIPRIGLPNIGKIALINTTEVIALSDCLFAIKANSIHELKVIQDIITVNWCDFKSLYDSTCAPYITMEILKQFLKGYYIDLSISISKNANKLDHCICY